jgi:hypothetical protein
VDLVNQLIWRSMMSRVLVWVSLGFLTISGALALVMPRVWTTLFGFPAAADDALAFARVAGVREIVLSMIAIVLIGRGIFQAAIVTVGLSTLIGVADFSVVAVQRWPEAAPNLVIHASGVVLLAITLLSFRQETRRMSRVW